MRYDRILVVVDVPTVELYLLTAAIAYGKATGAEVRFLHILPFDQLTGVADSEYDQTLICLRAWQAIARQSGVAASIAQGVNNPMQAVREMAQSWSADLIMIPKEQKSLSRFAQPLSYEAIAASVDCSVVAVQQLVGDAVSVQIRIKPTQKQQIAVTKAQLELLFARSG
ncbi:universal stress protein [Myxacorys almedinensis]|uniref:Universal stress protein n=1 Tax=Myxacorys almedinensis A TaxID=2690445 RepID=A0A8J8CGU8_9CYAN|nr:universal stress protein [Myxacorys almedinensis]NDJ16113.1 universal stress protein [Myxacorys almedinensis A]